MEIEISTETQVDLDNLRADLLQFADSTGDKPLIKKLETCSYDRLIHLLNVGYNEKTFQDTLKGTLPILEQIPTLDTELPTEARDLLMKILDEDTTKKKTERKMWKCVGKLKDGSVCGQIVLTEENPTKHFPKWKDGHKCQFEEVQDKNKHSTGTGTGTGIAQEFK